MTLSTVLLGALAVVASIAFHELGHLLAALAAVLLAALPAWGLRVLVPWVRLVSGLLFVATALPVPAGPFASDGLRFLRLAGLGRAAPREVPLLARVPFAETTG